MSDIGEDGLIEIFSVEAGSLGGKVLVPNGDDAAVWFVEPRYASVVSTDSLIEGVHFESAWMDPRYVGRKLVAINLSDVAAMGARPRYVLLSICVSASMYVDPLKAMASGIRDICKQHGVAVIGGNVSTTKGPMVLGATAIGRIEAREIMRRRGTLAGDAIYVTGRLGDARAGLRYVRARGKPKPDAPQYNLYQALVDPAPRIGAARRLAQSRLVHALCDISDGFGRDLRRLLEPEGLGARIEGSSLPMSPSFRQYTEEVGASPEVEALSGGEEYELLFTADPVDERLIVDACATEGTPVTRVGVVTASSEIEVLFSDGSIGPLPSGFEHFGG